MADPVIAPAISKAVLFAWLVFLPGVEDTSHHGRIHRPEGAARDIAELSESTPLPQVFAAELDVLAALESGYDPAAIGDNGRSCGAWQTPCGSTPMSGGWREEWESARSTVDPVARREALRTAHQHRLEGTTRAIRLGQGREAIRWLRWGMDQCPEHVLWSYASGHCAWSRAAEVRESRVREEMAVALPVQ